MKNDQTYVGTNLQIKLAKGWPMQGASREPKLCFSGKNWQTSITNRWKEWWRHLALIHFWMDRWRRTSCRPSPGAAIPQHTYLPGLFLHKADFWLFLKTTTFVWCQHMLTRWTNFLTLQKIGKSQQSICWTWTTFPYNLGPRFLADLFRFSILEALGLPIYFHTTPCNILNRSSCQDHMDRCLHPAPHILWT